MTEEELEKKNKRVENWKAGFKSLFKFALLYVIVCTAFMFTWNSFFHGILGLGREVQEWYLFGIPTLGLFATLRALSPLWLRLLDLWDIVIYSIVYFGFLYFTAGL